MYFIYAYVWASLVAQFIKKPPALHEIQVRSLAGRDWKREFMSLKIEIEMKPVEDRKLIDAKNVFDFIYPSYYMIDYEKLAVIYVDTLFHVIKKEEYTNNSKSHIEFPFKDITISALKTNCFGIFLVHNHPQGTLEPSMNDLNQTRKMSDILKAIDIHLFDHLIIAKGLYFSFSDSNILFEKKLT